jgi:hypothetical protein
VTFRIMLPPETDPALKDFVRRWEPSTQTHETSRGR